jgi:HlyD family secretion protein
MSGWPRRVRIGPALFTLALAAALAYGFWPRPLLVEVARVTRAPLQVSVEEEGVTRVIDRYVVSAPVAGYLRRIELEVGDAVARGGVLATLDPLRSDVLDPRSRALGEARVAAASASVRKAEEEVAAAEAEAEYARAEHRRVAGLCRVQCVSEDERDRAEARARQTEASLRSARFSVEVARHELEAARTALEHSAARVSGAPVESVAVRSPVQGQVLGVHRESEGVVVAGEALVEVGDPQALEVAVDVLSADAVRIGPGTRVVIDRWGGEGPLEGLTRRVEPVGFMKVSALGVEEQRVWVIVDITSEPERWARLGDGYRVEARFVLWEGQDVLQVPASAAFRHGGGWAVFVVAGARAERRPIQIGHRNGLVAEVLSGVLPGETVIVHPDERLRDGLRVMPRGLPEAGAGAGGFQDHRE